MRRDASFEDTMARFWAKVDKTSTCWLWMAATNYGYGTFTVAGRTVRAHRWLYQQVRGPLDANLVLDHLCRVRNCVNPDHLEAVTDAVNIQRGISPTAIHRRKTHCIHGHEFTPENTRIIQNGYRVCRKCRYESTKRQRAKRAGRKVAA